MPMPMQGSKQECETCRSSAIVRMSGEKFMYSPRQQSPAKPAIGLPCIKSDPRTALRGGQFVDGGTQFPQR